MVNQKEGKHCLSAFLGTTRKGDRAFRLSFKYLVMLCLFVLVVSVSWATDVGQQPEKASQYIVQDLRVDDVPNDDGSGLRVSWKPLDAKKRIIEYRVYRGTTPDSLYFVGSVPVNPQTGFPGERVNFYDSGYTLFVDISSPAKLKKEDQQEPGSPLFRNIPRALSVFGPMLKDYSILGVIPKDEFYYKTKKTIISENDKDNTYAGVNVSQFQSLLKKLTPDRPYYYTIVAVNERRVYYKYAPITVGIPRINAPEKVRNFTAIYLDDKERFQFEWTLPLNTDLLKSNNIYLVHQRDLQAFEEYERELVEIEENRLARLENPEIDPIVPRKTNPGRLIYSKSFTSENTATQPVLEGKIIDEINGVDIALDPYTLDQYYVVFSLLDWYGMRSFSNISKILIKNSASLPPAPTFVVTDKPDDKGDYLTLYWEKPVVFLTNSSFLNKTKTKLTVNYDFETNKDYKIKNFYFEVYDDENNLITKVDEFYQDMLFKINLPERYSPLSQEFDKNRKLSFKMTMKTSGTVVPEDYILRQEMVYDDDYNTYQPLPLYIEDGRTEKVQDFSYVVYKKPYTGETFRFASRSAGVIRQADDIVRYETVVYKGVNKFDLEKNLLLVDTGINAYYDKEDKRTVNTDIYLSVVEEKIKNYRSEIDSLKALLEITENDTERAQLEAKINSYQLYLTTNENEYFSRANSISSDKKRMKFLSKRRENELRTFQYKIVKTDGNAGFVETDVYKDESDNQYFIPVSNWFNKERIPTLIASLLFGFLVWFMIRRAKQGHDMYIRPIAGLQEIDNAIGRATEMGRPILFQPGLSGIGDVATLAGLSILGKVAAKAAEYDTKIIVPVRDYIVMPIAQEIVKDAHYEAGRPDTYDKSSVFFITTDQFAFVAGVNGVMIREKCATCFYMGMYYAEALLMTETGNAIGAVQIAGSDAVTQIPFFITTCDYTLIGEELYGASAYLSREPLMMGSLKAVDVTKFIILICLIAGTAFSTAKLTFFINIFPDK